MDALAPIKKINVGLTLGLAGAMAAPHCLYAYIWANPADFKEKARSAPLRILGGHAVEVMEKLVLGLKAIQVSTLLAWCEYGLLPACGFFATRSRFAVVDAVTGAMPARWMLGLAFLIPGQALNIGIYKAIGADGVYYGCKLDRPVPWATGFPFNLGIRHPQYVGAMLSWAGILTLLAATPSTAAPLGLVLAGWGGLYAASSYHEASSDMDPKK
eukprot:CAMPEP_0206422052 /NCGR_PEP_ID=MMETSP0324_2-20121206/1837_1 /ASSEMBLY_ACC=CAM_ASM_000836 /TAXON_ID=2866 /ORGANISM="Crypthecodinium cohnii, Strain Seligo" /LENGTH=213 /DNA_ID=CAMNT_0053886311 /DNA_START=84 /DNA_END=725 /DNA_ORIENTATION=+